jgi:enterochelin esterase-like enzyme
MNRIFIAACMGLFLCGSAFCDLSQPWNNPSGGTLSTGCKHLTFHSASNNTDIGYIIYLPPNYDSSSTSTTRYPVVYSFHGMSGNEWGNASIASNVQSDIKSNTINPMIWIFVSGHGNSFYADSKDGSIKCETSIVKELIPHVDSLFHTIPDRMHRATHGISMGGFGSMMMTFKHYDLFSLSVPNVAATVDWDTLRDQQFDQTIPKNIFGSDSNYFNDNYYPFTFVNKNADSLKAIGTKVRIVDNPQNTTMGPLYNYNVAMYKLLKNKNIYVEFDSTAGSGHVSASGTHLEDLLKFISNNFASATPVVSKAEQKSTASNMTVYCARMTSAGNFSIPQSWHATCKKVALYSIIGRVLGYENIEGKTMLDVKPLLKKYGDKLLLVKPVEKNI